MRPHHRTHCGTGTVASWLLTLAVGCNYDWEPGDPSDTSSADSGLNDSSIEPVAAADASSAMDGEANSSRDATVMDAGQTPATSDASVPADNPPADNPPADSATSVQPANDAASTQTSDAGRDATIADANTCASSQHMCSSLCVANDSVQSCGQACSPCVPPANGVSSCDGTQCGFMCMSSYHACGTSCASNSDVATCGTRCTPCPSVTGGKAVCTQGACGVTCDATYLSCGNACGPKSYGFEDGTVSGAARQDLNSTGATTQVLSSRTRARTGSRALSIGFNAPNSDAQNLMVYLPLCPSGQTTPITGSTVSYYVYVDGPASLAGTISIALRSNSSSGFVDRMYQVTITPNTWINLRGPVPASWGPLDAIGMYMYAYPQGSTSWSGTVYIDDVTIQ